MKFAATTLLIGALVGSIGAPAMAQEVPDEDQWGGGGGPHMGMGGGPGMGTMGTGAHKHMNLVLKAFNNQATGNTYTMLGMELLRSSASGWYGGFGCYKGLNLGVTAGADMAGHGGALFGKDFGAGPLTLGVGLLLGMGYNLTASPTLTFSNFAAYFVGEPRLNLGWVMSPHAELSVSAGYLATTNPTAAGGPTLMLTLSMIHMGMGHMGMGPTCGR